MLVAAIVGLEPRSTMDIDATCKGYPLTLESAHDMVAKIAAIDIDDDMSFELTNTEEIMGDSEYSGVRMSLVSHLEKARTSFKIDISTGDAITPSEIRYSCKLMLEDRCLNIWTHNPETILAEKLQTILARAAYNTRARDFYDVHALLEASGMPSSQTLRKAFQNTCQKRKTYNILSEAPKTLNALEANSFMIEQ